MAALRLTPAGALIIAAAAGAAAQQPPAPEMVRIAGGIYPIGSAAGRPSARPPHEVELAPFLIDATEVTNAGFPG